MLGWMDCRLSMHDCRVSKVMVSDVGDEGGKKLKTRTTAERKSTQSLAELRIVQEQVQVQRVRASSQVQSSTGASV